MDSVPVKLCKLCGIEKPLSEMVPYIAGKYRGYRHRCYDCENAEWRATAVTKLAHGPKSVLPRFEKYVNRKGDDDCWLWSGEIDIMGYGVMHIPKSVYGRHRMKAHRFSWEMVNGPIPEGGWMLHNCDVRCGAGDITYRRCVNPAHLRLGTPTDNNRDTVVKGRRSATRALREGSPTDEQVREIRHMYASGERQVEIARRYGLSPSGIGLIVRKKIRVSAGD